MKVADIFYSIQGEGVFAGVPSMFVRTSGCNLRCVWCDTPYTSWQPEGEKMMIGGILAAVRKEWPTHVVVTGGEPMMMEGMDLLTQRLKDFGMHVTVETAGTVYQPVACDLMSISPKLANSTPTGAWAGRHESLRIQPAVLSALMGRYDYQFKFVMQTPGDLDEVRSLVA